VEANRLHDLLAHRVDGVERGHGFLEHHRDLVPPQPAHLILGEIEEVPPAQEHLPAGDPAGRRGNEPKDAEGGHALPAPRLPTMPSVSPALTAKETPFTAATSPSSVWNSVRRSRTSRSGTALKAFPPRGAGPARPQAVPQEVEREHGEEDEHAGGKDPREARQTRRFWACCSMFPHEATGS